MGENKTYQDLDVWKQTRNLVKDIYQLTTTFPKDEQFGLINQLRRAAVSIPSNIAEGCGRNHSKDSIQFFFISRGSLYEIETQIIISCDLGYLSHNSKDDVLLKIQTCKKLLNGFINYFQGKSQQLTTINEQQEYYGNNNQD